MVVLYLRPLNVKDGGVQMCVCRMPNVQTMSGVYWIRIMDGHDAMNHISVDENERDACAFHPLLMAINFVAQTTSE